MSLIESGAIGANPGANQVLIDIRRKSSI